MIHSGHTTVEFTIPSESGTGLPACLSGQVNTRPRPTVRRARPRKTGLPACLSSRRGQATVEFAILSAGVVFPLIFGLIYVSEILWIWHSVADFTRDGANYAATHCWQASADNVTSYMKTHVPKMVDQDQFINGSATIQINYYSKDPTTGTLVDFSCDTECSTQCIPDAVAVHVTNYQFSGFVRYLGLPPVSLPNFAATATIESAGCDPDQGTCLP